MRKKKNHYRILIGFFSLLIIMCLLPLFFSSNIKKDSVIFHIPKVSISPDRLQDFAIIHTASLAGTVLCTDEDPSICSPNQEKKVLEYHLGCYNGNSASSIYICRSGRWEYIDWTANGYCQMCKKEE